MFIFKLIIMVGLFINNNIINLIVTIIISSLAHPDIIFLKINLNFHNTQ